MKSHRHLAERSTTSEQLTSERIEDGRPLAMNESFILHRDLANRYFDQARRRAGELK